MKRKLLKEVGKETNDKQAVVENKVGRLGFLLVHFTFLAILLYE